MRELWCEFCSDRRKVIAAFDFGPDKSTAAVSEFLGMPWITKIGLGANKEYCRVQQ